MDAVNARLLQGQIPKDTWLSFKGAIEILIFWHAFRVAQLKSFNRWFSVVFFLFWAVASIANVVNHFQRFRNYPRVLLFVFMFNAFNIACVWYLTRRSFREFAIKYVTEYENEKKLRDMQKISAKRVRNEKL